MISKELKQKWLEALRSGEYEQRIGFLNNDNRFCCLGVLAEVVGAKKVPSPASNVVRYKDGVTFSSGVFGYSVGLTENQIEKLIAKNDNLQSFEQIANYIEKNVGPKL